MNNIEPVICGLKLTHDGTVAVLRGNELIFSIEMEKIGNNARFSAIDDLTQISKLLNDYGIKLSDVNHFVIDGWAGLSDSWIDTFYKGEKLRLQVGNYREKHLKQNILQSKKNSGLLLEPDFSADYSSFMHVTGHLASAYCTSPFASSEEDSYVLVWDGGMFPRLYHYHYEQHEVSNLGPLFMITGNFYQLFASYFEPFNQTNPDHLEDLSIAGKVMAFIAKGQPREALIEQFESIVKNHLELSLNFPHSFVQRFKSNDDGQFSNEDILASMHVFLQRKLLDGLGKQLVRHSFKTHNICLTGGCALNIKWNSAIRNSGLFSNVWVHPFPNDSGSALGAACAKLMEVSAHRSIRWNVYQGPTVSRTKIGENWHQYSGDATQLAELLAKVQKPVVIIDGPAELGPRALGSRSILAPAHSPEMKDILNRIKNREPYRPVAPICLEEDAPAIFDPGSADPYMLFDHQVRKDWIERIPAVIHLDGTARLQTVGKHDNPFLYELLREYKKITSVPVLCNTSANYSGKGFFPDVRSVMEWGMVNYIWSNGQIYIKEGFQHHFETLSPTKDLVGSE